jgi:hypothetical protein
MYRQHRDRKMLTAAVTTDDLAVRISGALRREFGELSCAVQRIANAMMPPADPRAVRNWWDGKNAPNSAQLMRLGQVSIEVRLELVNIMAAQSRIEAIAFETRKRHEALALATDRARGHYLAGEARVCASRPDCEIDRAAESPKYGRRHDDKPFVGGLT